MRHSEPEKKMGRFAKSAYSILVVLLVLALAGTVTGRSLRHSSPELISDGIDDGEGSQSASIMLLKGMDTSSAEECEQMYGFLPCSNSILGHLFLILVYEYLLFHGESYVDSGGKRIFKLLGPGVFGGSVFQVLGALPESLILLASGLSNTKETAQEYVLTGVGLLAGSTIFLLTVVWGTCVIVGSRHFPHNLQSNSSIDRTRKNLFQKLLSLLTGHGIATDAKTSDMAMIMVFSVIPLIIIQIPGVFHLSSSGQSVVTIITLVISVVLLLLYFIYQVFRPWIQERRLEFLKHEYLVLDIINHVQRHAVGRFLTDDGAPNVAAIKRLFEEIDQDRDDCISFSELKEELFEIGFRKTYWDKDKAIAEVMEDFDRDGDEKITMDEFVNGFIKWLNQTKRGLDRRFFSKNSLQDIYRIFRQSFKKRKEQEMEDQLISEILKHIQSHALEALFTEDGTPDIAAIKRLFESMHRDENNCISQTELKELIVDIKFGKMPSDTDAVVAKIMEEFDVNRDQVINEEEFITAFAKWLSISDNQTPDTTESPDEIYQRKWKETDILVEERSVESSPWAWIKAIILLVFGIVLLAVLAEPLIDSVQNFSKLASLPPFFISFILVPLAINARAATSAITTARRKKLKTTSLAFSEIYGGVSMNNILGFSVLLSLIYFRGLSWDFSAEVLAVVTVCAIMGIAAKFRNTFPVWTSFIAFLLYPLSLLLVYVLEDFFWWS